MTLTLGERLHLMRLSADRRRRGMLAGVLSSPALRWRYGAPVAEQLAIVPQELRTADPSFASELEFGHFGLAGAVAYVGGGSPFAVQVPGDAWARELHGFGWLRHLAAAASKSAHDSGVALTLEWIATHRTRSGVAWEPAVIARRLISWINAAELLLSNVPQSSYDTITEAIGDQLVHLSGCWRAAPEGYARLLSLVALTYVDLVVAGHDSHLARIESQLAGELDRQILPDGGHVSRNPGTLVEILLDVLPLRTCFAARRRPQPPAIDRAVRRMMPMLRFLRLGDGTLARFNGMGAPPSEELATVLGYDDPPSEPPASAGPSGYARLARGGTIVLADIGPPPTIELAGAAHAGCLSFEMSSGAAPLLVNGGAPGPADEKHAAMARATASHNTLTLGGKSSSRIVRHPRFLTLIGGHPIRGPGDVTAAVTEQDGASVIEGHHDGYIERFRLLHRRRLQLAASGDVLEGTDRIGPTRGTLRLARDLPFAVHFHLHPSVKIRRSGKPDSVVLRTRSGERWLLGVEGAEIAVEESRHFADLTGVRTSLQVVLRGATAGETEVRWRLSRFRPRAATDEPTMDADSGA